MDAYWGIECAKLTHYQEAIGLFNKTLTIVEGIHGSVDSDSAKAPDNLVT